MTSSDSGACLQLAHFPLDATLSLWIIPFSQRGEIAALLAALFFPTFAPPSSSALCHGSQSSAISTGLLFPHPPPPSTNSSCHLERDFLQRLDVQENALTTAGQLPQKKGKKHISIRICWICTARLLDFVFPNISFLACISYNIYTF